MEDRAPTPHEELVRDVRNNEDYKRRISLLENLLAPHGQREVLWQLFRNGPTWDGDIVMKQGRDQLFDKGFASRYQGWSYLTNTGMQVAIAMCMDRDKEKHERMRITAGEPVTNTYNGPATLRVDRIESTKPRNTEDKNAIPRGAPGEAMADRAPPWETAGQNPT